MMLAIETATSACSVAVAGQDCEPLAEVTSLAGPAHTRRLLADTQHVLAMVGAGPDEIDTVVVGLGPGTFTGLRIGVATARALAQALGASLAGVPTLAALALALAHGDAAAKAVTLIPLIDGKRGEVFAACYGRAAGFVVHESGAEPGGRTLEECRGLAVVPAAQLQDFLSEWPFAIVGGDGAHRYVDMLPASVHLARRVATPTAGMVLQAWRERVPGVVDVPDDVLPIYGRAPDAARWTERNHAKRRDDAP